MGWKAPQQLFKCWKILRGDMVMIMAGKDKGLTGTISRVVRKQNRVIVEGRNLEAGCSSMVEYSQQTRIEDFLKAVRERAPCRVGYRYLEDGSKVRVSRGGTASGSIIPMPAILTERKSPKGKTGASEKDTAKEAALERTWDGSTGASFFPNL
ncbi:hypothetical protein CBR_g54238 [Chara braunii]|uniref:KOW domain-containing protein n=1 Tax=Chara braunii TaxID=69332 RepID=A0A388K7E2_CHABU|nr:hypothetical protein CBR_g54238 [Chara braunii]|eukprot:GBG65947.1 hypothetical protein CBR_g54238 [Chara braunii]